MLLDKSPRAKAVLELAAEKAGWGQPLPQGVGRGVSVQFAFATYTAQVAEVEVSKDGAVRVRRVVCAVDGGTVVNPDTVQAQIQGAVIFGITAALYGEITLKDGRVEQTNFDTYQVLRVNKAPAIEVHIVQSSEPPGGMGESGTSAIVPAVINAVLAATGKRLRKLPIDTAALKQPVCGPRRDRNFSPARRSSTGRPVLDRSLILRLKGVTATGRYDGSRNMASLDAPRHMYKSLSQARRGLENPIFTNLPAQCGAELGTIYKPHFAPGYC